MINPLGFALEHFDAVGRFRKEENGKPVDAAGDLPDAAPATTSRSTAPATWPTSWPAATRSHDAFVEQLFHHLVKQPVRAYGADEPERT